MRPSPLAILNRVAPTRFVKVVCSSLSASRAPRTFLICSRSSPQLLNIWAEAELHSSLFARYLNTRSSSASCCFFSFSFTSVCVAQKPGRHISRSLIACLILLRFSLYRRAYPDVLESGKNYSALFFTVLNKQHIF